MNEIVNFIQQNASELFSFATPVIEGLVGGVFATLFTGKNEMKRIKTEKLGEVAMELIEQGKMSHYEFYKCRNFLKIAKLADEACKEQEKKTDTAQQTMDFDWFMRFFDAAGNISNEELQMLWSQILLNEINHPQSCSLRTLSLIRDMTSKEANIFQKMAKYIVHSGSSCVIFPNGFYDEHNGHSLTKRIIKKDGLNYEDHVQLLMEAGVLTGDHSFAAYFDQGDVVAAHNEHLMFQVRGYKDEQVLFSEEALFLTSAGKEIFHVIKNSPNFAYDNQYALACFKEFKDIYKDLEFSAFDMTEGSELEGVDLLSDELYQV